MWRAGQNYVDGETLASDQEPFQVEKLRLFSEKQGSKLTPKPGTSAFNIYTSTSLKTKSTLETTQNRANICAKVLLV